MTNDHKKIDDLLSEWHEENRITAEQGREKLISRLQSEPIRGSMQPDGMPRRARTSRFLLGNHGTGALAAALFVIVALIAVLVLQTPQNSAMAGVVQVPDGGRLEAFEPDGRLIGPCPLKHTGVNASVVGPFVRVELSQHFENTYQQKIEAVYTFPMSHRGAVDRMKMTITDPEGGERVVIGEVKERSLARYIYEQAKASGYVASLLEQERPNIFTQSIANIEAGASVLVEISYVEVLQAHDGEYAFEFPTVVGPRYIPGVPTSAGKQLPDGVEFHPGVILRGPAQISVVDIQNDAAAEAPAEDWSLGAVNAAMANSISVKPPSWANNLGMLPAIAEFKATYSDESKETGYMFEGGYGVINDRWFLWQLPEGVTPGSGFSPDTDQVPDASKITPMPVKPPTRAGHDISINVTLDTGGIPITSFEAPLHEIEKSVDDGVVMIALKNQKTIPNRDFVLRWRLKGDKIEESTFMHVANTNSDDLKILATDGGYLSMVLAPPARVEDDSVRARELIFVLDTSGSMRGFPIEKSKAVARQAISKMRAGDTFNVITFAGKTAVLWPEPKSATEANQAEAMRFIDTLQGGGGTEMMNAINAALVQTASNSSTISPEQLSNLPADDRKVSVEVPRSSLIDDNGSQFMVVREGFRLPVLMSVVLPQPSDTPRNLVLVGSWATQAGNRILNVSTARYVDDPSFAPMRIAIFFTDAYVGNDQGIIQAVRDNAGTTRVFGFGIGDSVNRYLLDEMSSAGRGEVEYVLLNDEADAAAMRLARRIQTPVLTDISITIDGVEVTEVLPQNPAGLLPDLYDEQPIVFHARYTPPKEGVVKGSVTIKGTTGNGRYERTMPVEFPATETGNEVISTLWARAKVDHLLNPHLAAVENENLAPEIKGQVIRLGEAYSIMTPYTSFIAVEKSRVTIQGKPMLVNVPIELPSGTSWEGFFGSDCPPAVLKGQMELYETANWHHYPVDSKEASRFDFQGNTDSALAEKTETKESSTAIVPPPIRMIKNKPANQNLGTSTIAMDPSHRYGSTRTRGSGRTKVGLIGSAPGSLAPASSAGIGSGGGGGKIAGAELFYAESDASSDNKPKEMPQDVISESGEVTEEVETNEKVLQDSSEETKKPTIDLDRIWRTLDRPLLMLALGATPEEVKGLPAMGVDGKPYLFEGTVEVTVLWNRSTEDYDSVRKSLERAGLVIQGSATGGSIVVGRIPVAKLLDLAQVEFLRRIVPSS